MIFWFNDSFTGSYSQQKDYYDSGTDVFLC
jgi:hypothetical protein